MAPVEPELIGAADRHRGMLAWRLAAGSRVLSSAPVGGGWRVDAPWIVNVGVAMDFGRRDLDAYVAEVAGAHACTGDGVGLLTGADVSAVQGVVIGGVRADVTVGIGKPTWAADPTGGWSDYEPGTINAVVQLPVAMSAAAQVNLVMTVTEAKTQALLEAGVPGTGTASDAVVIVSPAGEGVGEAFGGPRSSWGARAAQAVHQAVADSIAATRG